MVEAIAPDKGTGSTEARQPVLVYALHRREDRDAPNVIAGILVENTDSEVTMLSPLGQSVRVIRLYRVIPLKVQGTVFLADLMELPFGEFDSILRMDWLVKYRVSLDCTTKRVVLRTEKDTEEKFVWKGCEAFLAYISVSDSRDSSVEDIGTVSDSLDVFPEELSGFPPSQEVEFEIELISGTALVSIAPYRVAPKEMTELKA
ncbi:uncharacterized protein LOC108450878 [Gossypium arboreum]|uniref:uncharacterized protein LOC108450878 n=1 Tax=Gossypium arboreum TaxID=29729 RepID=UPI0022F15BA4|nr:uncharacterized protein LOC108450878 [Gossypium arboreum]